ncbi:MULTISPECIES: hypothetical protein [Myxococcus]|uniref:hypothetical protein n=1 Tax=Myxococcus TaxID=32 RepID=UPI00030FA703|nr:MULTISPECIES: hypothetical protein [Myxococcus]NOJ51316.1 hypothetical protein [Myxococcus xanthus]QPM79115.1 hypothetical protein I5Q59_33580 [Myxococcus xanthus]QVW68194.1 hypothetical protein JTM82_01110 [Myxococcus xanthus DZ2]QZZ54431.1 hypothetical protein MyxoNM_34900 [Myxococcus xanthus]UEO05692.1 hypothetical protein K1515_03870 [Myxococcus xanthus DZ2]
MKPPSLAACALAVLLSPCLASANEDDDGGVRTNTARLLTTDAAEVIDAPVLGLQRTALPLFAGLAVDTSMYANALLAPNVGLRWAMAASPHRVVLGARYTHFVGASVYSDVVTSGADTPALQRFEPELSGPSFYGVYGLSLGPVLVQGEARYGLYTSDYLSFTGALAFNFAGHWSVVGEAGVRVKGGSTLRAAAGIRYGGEHFGLGVGATYVDMSDPALPGESLPVLPVVDLSWSFR